MNSTLRTLLDRVEQGEGADWIDHNGTDCPVHHMTIVRPRYRGEDDPEKGVRIDWPVCAGRLDWSHDGGPDDITAYRIEESALLRAKIAQEERT